MMLFIQFQVMVQLNLKTVLVQAIRNRLLARIGVRMFLDKQFDQVSYFGRGPMENYADRKRGFDVGIYKSTVKEQLTPYEKPMDCGNHEDVRWAKVTTASGNGIMAQSDNYSFAGINAAIQR